MELYIFMNNGVRLQYRPHIEGLILDDEIKNDYREISKGWYLLKGR